VIRPHLLLCAFLGIGCPPAEEPPTDGPADIAFPPANPFLADSPWPISHGSPHSQGSTPLAGLRSASARVDFVEVGLPSITLVPTPPYSDGTRVAWGSTPTEVVRISLGDGLAIADRMPSGGGLADLVGGAYTLLDREGTFFTVGGSEVRAFGDADADDPDSAIEERGTWALPEPDEDESLRGLGLTYDGVLVAVSSAGRVLALSRDLTLLSELRLAGEVSNSIAVDEQGGIYIVTSEAMHRVQWTGEELSADPATGAWEAAYASGDGQPVPGRLGLGSGSTPSLMTVGDDRLVVITDARPRMNLVLFWRDALPPGWAALEGADVRVAGQEPVTFGDPSASTSVSEQSVLVMGDGAVVVNNDYGGLTGITPVLAGVAPPGIERFTWDSASDTLSSAWSVSDLSCPNGIPSASAATGLMYCVGKREDTWTLEAIHWSTGEPRFFVPLGDDNLTYNSAYSATEIGPDGSILTGTFTGAVWIRPE
jgi:hypothetical protein